VPAPQEGGTIAEQISSLATLKGLEADTNPKAAKTRALQAAYRKAQAAHPREDAPSAGQIRSLGLLDAPAPEKDIKRPRVIPSVRDDGVA